MALGSAPGAGPRPAGRGEGEVKGGGWGGVVVVVEGSVYLRKYQASSATMSSSRDTTSTVGRM